MTELPADVTGVVGTAAALLLSAFGWMMRGALQRLDLLEERSLTRSEFEAFCKNRVDADDARTLAIQRLEAKIDVYHNDITSRIDRMMEHRK